MYDSECILCYDDELNELHDKYVQSQMTAALQYIIRSMPICEKFEKGIPLVSDDIRQLKQNVAEYFPCIL